jgi:hypothetical protein
LAFGLCPQVIQIRIHSLPQHRAKGLLHNRGYRAGFHARVKRFCRDFSFRPTPKRTFLALAINTFENNNPATIITLMNRHTFSPKIIDKVTTISMGYEDHSTPMKLWQTLSLCFQLVTALHTQLHHATYSLNHASIHEGTEAMKIFLIKWR